MLALLDSAGYALPLGSTNRPTAIDQLVSVALSIHTLGKDDRSSTPLVKNASATEPLAADAL